MDYSSLVSNVQVAGLVLMAVSAVGLLRLVVVHYVQRNWWAEQVQSMNVITSVMAAGLLLLAFAGGGHLASRLFETNQMPNLPRLGLQALLMTLLAGSVIFLHVVAAPWLARINRRGREARPLVLDLTVNKSLAMTLGFAIFASAWTLWPVIAASEVPPQLASSLSALTFMTMLFWALLGLPALVLRLLAVRAMDEPDLALDVAEAGVAPAMPDAQQHRYAHVPAPRAPRPSLVSRDDQFNG
jgi:hypothetical protein